MTIKVLEVKMEKVIEYKVKSLKSFDCIDEKTGVLEEFELYGRSKEHGLKADDYKIISVEA